MANPVDIVLQVSSEKPEVHFVEIEVNGKSIKLGRWIKRDDGLWAIRITREEFEAAALKTEGSKVEVILPPLAILVPGEKLVVHNRGLGTLAVYRGISDEVPVVMMPGEPNGQG